MSGDLDQRATPMKCRVRRVYIFEPRISGHHGPYLTWMVEGLLRHGLDVTVITAVDLLDSRLVNLMKLREMSSGHLQAISVPDDLIKTHEQSHFRGLALREFRYWCLFKRWYSTHVDRDEKATIFLPYLDYCLYAIGVLGSPFKQCPWAGLAMRPSFHYRAVGIVAPRSAFARVKKMLFFRVLRNRYLRRLLSIDEPLSIYLAGRRHVTGKFAFFPQPAEFAGLPLKAEAKRKLGVAQDRKLILLYGAVTLRKGVVDLLRALAAPCFPSAVDVMLAGKISDPNIRRMLSEPWARELEKSGRLKLVDRFIESTEEPVLYAAADIVWVGYQCHYNASGLLVQAASAGRPVLACKEGVVGWQTERYGLGRAVNTRDSAEVAAAVDALMRAQKRPQIPQRRVAAWSPASFSEAQANLIHAIAGV